jgi:hypothetical protein
MFYSSQDQLKSVWLFVHDMLMVGSLGAGKTLLARTIPGILPEMSINERIAGCVPHLFNGRRLAAGDTANEFIQIARARQKNETSKKGYHQHRSGAETDNPLLKNLIIPRYRIKTGQLRLSAQF